MIKITRIQTKLLLSHVTLILTMVIITLLSFHFLSERYLIQEAKQQMKADADSMLDAIAQSNGLSDPNLSQRIAEWRELRSAGKRMPSKILVLDRSSRIIYTNLEKGEAAKLRLEQQDNRDYLIVRRQIVNASGATVGRIILATKVKDVNGLNLLVRRTQLFSLLIGGFVALLLGAWLGRGIVGPIRKLAASMRSYSPKQENPQIPRIAAQDETRELADAFQTMAERLRTNQLLQTEFLQNASHELKTPLMAIQGNAEAIKDGIVEGKEADESLDIIIAECQSLKAVVDELLYLTRLDSAAAETYRFEGQPIGGILEDAAGSLRSLAEQKGIALVLEGDLDAAGSFDAEKLRRAFLNLVGNALRYAGTRVLVRATRIADATAGAKLEIAVVDDGPGFAPGEVEHIFDRFYKGQGGGTGIGLAITRAIIEAHGGTVAASQGEPPVGAILLVTLPTE